MRDDKLSLMAIGHEIWLGDVKTEDVGAELDLSYGHNMKQDGSLDPKRITPLVYTPTGTTQTPSLTPKDDHYQINLSDVRVDISFIDPLNKRNKRRWKPTFNIARLRIIVGIHEDSVLLQIVIHVLEFIYVFLMSSLRIHIPEEIWIEPFCKI